MKHPSIIFMILVLAIGPAWAQSFGKPVRDPGLIAQRAKAFQKDFSRQLGLSVQVTDCTHMVQFAVGVRGGNFFYGAICKVKAGGNERPILICDDVMIGNFALTNNFAYTDASVADFTRSNCTGS